MTRGRVLLALFAAAVVLCGGCMGAVVVYALFGPGYLVVLGPYGGASVGVDGSAPVAVADGELRYFDVPRGPHSVRFDDGRPIPFEIELGGHYTFVGGSPDRCYVELDISPWMYASMAARPFARFRGDQPFEAQPNTIFAFEDAPERIEMSDTVWMIVEYDCALEPLGDEALVEALGLTGKGVGPRHH